VFGLKFHHLLTFLFFPLQAFVFASVCFAKCVLLQLLVLSNATSFVYCQIHLDKFLFFGTMVVIPMKEVKLVVVVDDLNFGIKDVTFETKVFNRYGTFDLIANKNMEYPSYAYLHFDLLDRPTLITIILRVKSPHIEMHE
jgi:hypothetical protein